jgi:hypothetical protein
VISDKTGGLFLFWYRQMDSKDDKFEKACLKLNLNIKVLNPRKYLTEGIKNEHNS